MRTRTLEEKKNDPAPEPKGPKSVRAIRIMSVALAALCLVEIGVGFAQHESPWGWVTAFALTGGLFSANSTILTMGKMIALQDDTISTLEKLAGLK